MAGTVLGAGKGAGNSASPCPHVTHIPVWGWGDGELTDTMSESNRAREEWDAGAGRGGESCFVRGRAGASRDWSEERA